jgi:hypothetical protein
VELKASKNR